MTCGHRDCFQALVYSRKIFCPQFWRSGANMVRNTMLSDCDVRQFMSNMKLACNIYELYLNDTGNNV